jgi:dihydrofolate reductase
MSLDGYVAGPGGGGFEHLFAWYDAGDIALTTANPGVSMHVTETGAAHVRRLVEGTGALVVGRTLFDQVQGWGGRHPIGCPVVVLSHSVPDGWPREDAPFTFVTEGGIGQAVAVARETAADRGVGLNAGTIASQALDAGLVDEVWIDLVPVILGGGAPFFAALAAAPFLLDGPVEVHEDVRVTHLRYRVRR